MSVTLKPKVVLRQKGENLEFSADKATAILRWKSSVDLDLHVMFELKSDSPRVRVEGKKPGFFGKLLGQKETSPQSVSSEGHISFRDKGRLGKYPWIKLSGDEGVGDTGGDNEETMWMENIHKFDHILIVANRFGKQDKFSNYDGVVEVKAGEQHVEVPLTEDEIGSWCTVARIDNTGAVPKLINVNKTQSGKPTISQFK